MDKIIAVIKFDISVTRKYAIMLLIWFSIMGMYFSYLTGDLYMLPVNMMIWAAMIGGLPFRVCEKNEVSNLFHTFPISRKRIITARYVYLLAIGFICLSLSEIMLCVLAGFFSFGFNMSRMTFALCLGFLLFCLIISIQLPMYFKYSFKSGITISPVFLYLVLLVLYQVYYGSIIRFDHTRILWRFPGLSAGLSLLTIVLLIFSSYLISCKVFINKDV